MNEQVHQSVQLVKFNFQGDELDVFPGEGTAHVVIRRVCEALGISFQGQIEKLRDHAAICLKMILMQMPGDDQRREVACIEVRSLPLWLATIHPTKVRPEAQAKLVAYQREAAEVLADHFLGRRGATVEIPPEMRAAFEAFPELLQQIAELKQLVSDSNRPIIGTDAAKLYILDNLREIARIQAATIQKPQMARALRFKAERRLRVELDFPMTYGMRWGSFPRARLGEAVLALARMLGEARSLSEVATSHQQLPLRLVRPGSTG